MEPGPAWQRMEQGVVDLASDLLSEVLTRVLVARTMLIFLRRTQKRQDIKCRSDIRYGAGD